MKLWFVGPACGLAVTIAVLGSSRTQAQTPGGADVDKLWDRIYPVFAHDRCASCHGRVQSYPGFIYSVTGETHPGGDVRDGDDPVVDCGECHKQTPAIRAAWKFTAPASMEWADKRIDEVCAIEAAQVHAWNEAAGGAEPSRKDSYLYHLATDVIVDSAWRGRAGGGRDYPDQGVKPDLPSPPLSKPEFLAAAADWVNAGAPCRSSGSISQVESFTASYSTPFPLGIDGKMVISTTGRREVLVIRHTDGTAVANVRGSGHDIKVATYTQMIPAGVCHVTMTDKTDWTTIGPTGGPTTVTTKVQNDGYEIGFVVPDDPATPAATVTQSGLASSADQQFADRVAGLIAFGNAVANRKGDTTSMTASHRLTSDCGLPSIDTSDEPIEANWPPWQFTIRCPSEIPKDGGEIRCDPREPGQNGTMTGQMIRKVFAANDAFDPQSWLNVSPIGTGIVDMQHLDKPQQIPVTVTTRWGLSLGHK